MNKHSWLFMIFGLPFKFQGQRRNSSEAGVQTEPVTVTPAAEKAKWNQKQHSHFPVQTSLLLLNLYPSLCFSSPFQLPMNNRMSCFFFRFCYGWEYEGKVTQRITASVTEMNSGQEVD